MNFSVSDFWYRVKKQSKSKSVTQKDLCAQLKCPVQTLRNKINRGAYPSITDCIIIARYLDTTVEYLVTGDELEYEPVSDNTLQDKLNRIADIINE